MVEMCSSPISDKTTIAIGRSHIWTPDRTYEIMPELSNIYRTGYNNMDLNIEMLDTFLVTY
jgi:hypothetical protein